MNRVSVTSNFSLKSLRGIRSVSINELEKAVISLQEALALYDSSNSKIEKKGIQRCGYLKILTLHF